MSILRVLIATPLYPPSIGGPATYTRVLEEQLPKHDIEVRVVSFDKVRHLLKGLSHLVYLWKVFKESKDVDVIYAQDPVSVGLPAFLASFLRRKKFVLKIVGDYAWEQGTQRFGVTDILDVFVSEKRYSFPVKILKNIQSFVAGRADKVIVPSKYLKNIVSVWGIDPNKISVIYNSIDVGADLKSAVLNNNRQLVSAGRLVPWKGFDVLIDTMSGIIEKYPDAQLHIYGDGPLKEELSLKIKNKKIEKNVFICKPLAKTDLINVFKKSQIMVLNTKYEGFSHLILEAMACGLPVITTNVGGNLEIINDKENGFLVEPDNISQFSQYIFDLFENSDLSLKISRSARETVSKFSQDNMINQLIQELQ